MSGIYKSRLFNFLNRQRIRFSNQLEITLRHLQLATETGVQILLYPVYIIARTSISVRQQLKSPAASSPEFELTGESDAQSSATKVKISREKRSTVDDLWLEEEDNNLAITTSKINSLANSATSQKKASGLSLQRQNNSNNSETIAPVRLLQKMFDWVKTSPVATKLNLFGESSIVDSSPIQSLTNDFSSSVNSSLSGKETVFQPETKSFFSKLFGRLGLRSPNSSQLLKNSHSNISTTESSAQESFTIQVLIRRAIAYFFGHKQQLLSGKKQKILPSTEYQKPGIIKSSQIDIPVVASSQLKESKSSLVSQVNSWLEKVQSSISRSHSLTTESSAQESFAIQVLIRRAIAYFFGHKQQLLSGKKQEALTSVKSPEPSALQLFQANLPIVDSPQSKESKSSLLSQVDSWFNKANLNNSSSDSLNSRASAEDSLNLKILIRRAISYFFGKKPIKFSNYIEERSFATLPFSSLNLSVESKNLSFSLPLNRWNLKLSDITVNRFCLPENYLIQDHSLSIIETNLPELTTISNKLNCKKSWPIDNFSSEIIQESSFLVVTTNFPPICTTKQDSLTVTSDSSDSLVANIPLEFSSDLWEAEVITVGYVTNILESILEFLDKISWWIEKQFLKLWQFFKQIFKEVITKS